MKKTITFIFCLVLAISVIPFYSSAVVTVGDYEALQNAIANAGDTATINIDGKITVEHTIFIRHPKKITLTGGTLVRAASLNGSMIDIPSHSYKGSDPYKNTVVNTEAVLTLKNITLDGNKAKAGEDTDCSIITMDRGAKLVADSAVIQNAVSYGICQVSRDIFTGSISLDLKNTKIRNNGKAGVSTIVISNGNKLSFNLDSCEITGNGTDGLVLNESAVIKNCIIEKNGDDGIFYRCKNGVVLFDGGSISNNAGHGVSTSEGEFQLASGKISSNGKSGIYMTSTDASALISGGEISGNKTAGIESWTTVFFNKNGKVATDNDVILHEWFNSNGRGTILVMEKLSYTGTVANVSLVKTKNWEWIYIEKGCADIGQFNSTVDGKIFKMNDNGWATLANKPPKTVPSVNSITAKGAGIGKIKLSWTKISGALGYRIYRIDNKQDCYSLVKTVTGTSYTDTGLTAGKTYYYRVYAYMNDGGKQVDAMSSPTASAVCTIPKVSSLTASQTTSSITLKWKAMSGATGYIIYEKNTKTGKFTEKARTAKASYTVKSLKSGNAYTFAVKAYKTVGKKAVTSSSYATIKTASKPDKPTSLAVTSSSSKAILSWKKVTGADGYEVYMATAKSGKYTKLSTVKTASYTKKGLKKSTVRYFKVRSYKSVGGTKIYSSYSSIKSIKIK